MVGRSSPVEPSARDSPHAIGPRFVPRAGVRRDFATRSGRFLNGMDPPSGRAVRVSAHQHRSSPGRGGNTIGSEGWKAGHALARVAIGRFAGRQERRDAHCRAALGATHARPVESASGGFHRLGQQCELLAVVERHRPAHALDRQLAGRTQKPVVPHLLKAAGQDASGTGLIIPLIKY